MEALAESQWNCRVILNPNHVKTMPRTCMSFVLLNKKLLSWALLKAKPSHGSFITSSLSLAWQPSGSGSFSLATCPWSNFHLLPHRESVQPSRGWMWALSFLQALRMPFISFLMSTFSEGGGMLGSYLLLLLYVSFLVLLFCHEHSKAGFVVLVSWCPFL